jgi:hypothetical protein
MTKEITLSQNQYLGLKVPTTDYPNEFIQFCEMFAYPSTMRKHKDQLAFARAYKISNNTLTNWKKTVEFNDNIRIIAKQVIGNDLPKLMHIVKERALKGDNKATDTLLKWLGELQDTEVQIDKAVIFTWAHDNSIVKPLSDIDSTVIDA